jgi:small GTP-binding protein
VEDAYTVQIDSEICKGKEFKILDTAGEEDYQNLLDEWISSASAFILMYAINDRETFESLKAKVRRIEKNGATGIPIIIVGNKYDLKDQRTVSEEEAKEYAKSLNAKYFETSALTDENGNVKIVFQECGAMILSKNNETEEKKKCVCSIF